MEWTEVGPGCFARRYDSFDVTVGAVIGTDGVLLIDTRASLAEAAELREHVRQLSAAPVRWVINTHWHFDHCFGNAEFGGADIWAHDTVPATLAQNVPTVREWLAERSDDWRAAMDDLVVAPPTRTLASSVAIDLGDRAAEVVHLGRGHTDGDVVVRVADAAVVYAGDLVEQSGAPAYGDDCFPLEWPATLARLEYGLSDRTVVVPGHGALVDRRFVGAQRASITGVAETIRELAASGVDVADALRSAEWPYPREVLTEAVRRGYAQLPRPPETRTPSR